MQVNVSSLIALQGISLSAFTLSVWWHEGKSQWEASLYRFKWPNDWWGSAFC
jgi:hypothetical protein